MNDQIFVLGTQLEGGETPENLTRRIGQKAAVLNRLKLAGFPVPDGICIPTSVFGEALAPFASRIGERLSGVDLSAYPRALAAAREIALLLADMTLPADLLDQLGRRLPKLGSGLLAVRSSAGWEDLAGRSFAGQYQSVLAVDGQTELTGAILTCWRSYFSANALAARAGLEEAGDDPGMAVIIQPLVAAECAGVCFSVDPLRMRPDLALVSAAWGLGAGVTDGSVATDTIRLRRIDLGIDEQIIGDKVECMRASPRGGLERVGVPEAQRRIASLPESWLERVAQFSLAAEQEMGSPQDVEWAIAEGQVWILQSRPITNLPEEVRQAVRFPVEWNNPEESRYFWQLERFNQHPGALLLPGEVDFIKYRTRGGEAAVQYAGGSKTRWRKAINGRMYINVADSTLSPGEVRVRSAAMADLFERMQEEDITIWEHWGPEIIQATKRLATFDARSASGETLADHLDDALAASQRHWMVHTFVPRRGRLDKVLDAYQRLTGKSRAEANEEISFLLQGPATIHVRLIDGLYDLACLALEALEVARLVAQASEEAWNDLQALQEAAPFLEAFEEFMAEYGERLCYRRWEDSSYDLPLPWREAPAHVLEMVARYLPLASENRPTPRDARERAYQNAQARVDALCAGMHAEAPPTAANEFRRRLSYARRNALFTDEHNHYIDQLAEGQVTHALVHAGRWLAQRGDLNVPADIYWLHLEEVMRALRANQRQDFSEEITRRKAQFEAWSRLHPPAVIGVPDPKLPERANAGPEFQANDSVGNPAGENKAVGQTVSRGRRSGRARVVPQFSHLPEITAGDVLVAWYADTEWTPVFAVLSGIVFDVGSVGDHAAITAREFGIPAVFACGDASRRIPEGAWVTVDGDKGVVEWE
jgi:phosphohistidine swiveling domain-containing protein